MSDGGGREGEREREREREREKEILMCSKHTKPLSTYKVITRRHNQLTSFIIEVGHSKLDESLNVSTVSSSLDDSLIIR